MTPGGKSIRLRGENSSLIAHDTITVRPDSDGSQVTYQIEFAFQGLLRWAEPLLRLAVGNLMDNGAQGCAANSRKSESYTSPTAMVQYCHTQFRSASL